jgi:hypothetical protein
MVSRRRVAAWLTGAAFVLIGLGVAALVFNPGFPGAGSPIASGPGTTSARPSSLRASVSATVPPSPSPVSGGTGTTQPGVSASPVVSLSPSSHPDGFVQQGNDIVYYADDGSTVPVQPVLGLEVRIQSGRAIYYALPANRFGLKTDSYAGEFIPFVNMGQADGSSAETGGMVLAGSVVTRLIEDKLATIKSDYDRWIVALPVDIRSSPRIPVDVSFDQFGLAGWSNTPRVVVRFSGSLPVVEANPSNGGYHVLVEQLGVTAWQVIDPTRLSLPSGSIDPAHAMNQLLIYGNGAPSVQRDILYDRPVAVGQPMLSAASEVSVSLVVNGSRADLGPDKILTVGDVPVFVASS